MNVQSQKLLRACGNDTQNYSQENYNQLYLRKTLLDLISYDKPIIVTGFVELNPYDNYYSFRNIKPFAPKYEDVRTICGHVNIFKRDIAPYLNLNDGYNYTNELFVLVCRPYRYYDKDNEVRGGLRLTDELHIPPIMFYEEAIDTLQSVNPSKYIDWFQYNNGYYLGTSVILFNLQNQQRKRHDKYLRKQQRKKDKLNLPFLYTASTPIKENETVALDYWFVKI